MPSRSSQRACAEVINRSSYASVIHDFSARSPRKRHCIFGNASTDQQIARMMRGVPSAAQPCMISDLCLMLTWPCESQHRASLESAFPRLSIEHHTVPDAQRGLPHSPDLFMTTTADPSR